MDSQKTVFITGAGSGIGVAVAHLFANRGWVVGLYDRNLDSVRNLAEKLNGSNVFGYVDVTRQDSVEKAIQQFADVNGGRLDVMVNNAGLFQDKRFVDADSDYLELMMRVNMDGVVNCARAAYPLLKNTPDSHLVNMGSASAIYGVPNSAVYSATKFFVRGLTEALRIEWDEDDITVNTVMPSYVATPMTEGIDLSHDQGGKLLSADEIAAAVWEAATSDGMYWVMPGTVRFQWALIRKIPLKWVPALSRRIFLKGVQN